MTRSNSVFVSFQMFPKAVFGIPFSLHLFCSRSSPQWLSYPFHILFICRNLYLPIEIIWPSSVTNVGDGVFNLSRSVVFITQRHSYKITQTTTHNRSSYTPRELIFITYIGEGLTENFLEIFYYYIAFCRLTFLSLFTIALMRNFEDTLRTNKRNLENGRRGEGEWRGRKSWRVLFTYIIHHSWECFTIGINWYNSRFYAYMIKKLQMKSYICYR